jgi:hypothetical protein
MDKIYVLNGVMYRSFSDVCRIDLVENYTCPDGSEGFRFSVTVKGYNPSPRWYAKKKDANDVKGFTEQEARDDIVRCLRLSDYPGLSVYQRVA